MEIKRISFAEKTGWSEEFPTALDSANTMVLIFGASLFINRPSPLNELIDRFPNSQVIGCSTSGEIFGAAINDASLSIAIVKFEHTTLRRIVTNVFKRSDSYLSGQKIADELTDPDLRGVFLLADSANIDGSQLVAGLNSKISSSVIVTGGFAGVPDQSESSWVLCNGMPERDAVSAIGFYGENVRIGYGSRDGLDILGIEQRITKAVGNQLFEIDGKPALSLYRNYLGDKAGQLPESANHFPISIRENLNSEKRIIRAVLEIDEANQSMSFGGRVPEGAMARLMIANADRVIDGAAEAAMMTEQYGLASNSILSIAISGSGRRAILKERCGEEVEGVIEEMPDGTEQVGFYSSGEICPYTVGSCDLHNQTMTLTIISEEPPT